MPVNVPIAENWARTDWSLWTTGNPTTVAATMGDNPSTQYDFGLRTQTHIDIADFDVDETWTYTGSVSTVTTGRPSALNHQLAITVTSTAADSVTLDRTFAAPLDLSSITNGYLYLTFPDTDPSDLVLSSCSIELIDGANTVTLPFSTSLNTPTQSNPYLKFNQSSFASITQITGLVITLDITAAATIYLAGLRLAGPQWIVSDMDFDNANETLGMPMYLSPSDAASGNQVLPALWRSAATTGNDDPCPINTDIGVIFNTGSQAYLNSITVLLRGNSQTPVLESALEGVTQGSLNGLPEPGWIDSPTDNNFNIDFTLQWGLSGSATGYVLSIGSTVNSATSYSYSSEASPSILVPQLTSKTDYLLYVSLKDDVAQALIYPIDAATGMLDVPIFDTSPIKDTGLFVRQSGHIGFNANLLDGDAYVKSIHPYHTTFAEFQSVGFNSISPVWGAQLSSLFTPPTQLFTPPWTGLSAGSSAPVISNDFTRTQGSISSTRVDFLQGSVTTTLPGIISPVLSPPGDTVSGITDFTHTSLSFDIWALDAPFNNFTYSGPFILLLINEQGYGLQLPLPRIVPNQWQSVNVSLAGLSSVLTSSQNTILTSGDRFFYRAPAGKYQLALLYSGQVPTTIWLENVSVLFDAIEWQGRAYSGSVFDESHIPWTPFGNTINNPTSGIRFIAPGTSLQVKATALQQAGSIFNGYILEPVYGQLGNFVWDPAPIPTPLTTSGWQINSSNTGKTFTFSATGIQSAYGPITSLQWSFGDGSWASGTTVTHTYQDITPSIGTYTVTLVASDTLNNYGTINLVVDA